MDFSNLGWIDNPAEVEKALSTMHMPMAAGNLPSLDDKKEVFLYENFRQVVKADPPKGPQGIGDCVSWGWSNLINYIAAMQIWQQLKSQGLLNAETPEDHLVRNAIIEEYQETATEAMYALARVEIGGQRGSYEDGAVGAWAAKAATDFGTISRKALIKAGLSGPYDKNRAKDWGAKGLPDNLEPIAKTHLIKTTSLITDFDQAGSAVQNGYPVAICSNRGFTMTRDNQGFCAPSGVWNHCMLIVGVRFDRPGCCISQSWGANTPQGPTDKNQPDNTFWADASVINYILKQQDSFTASQFMGYQAQDVVTWRH